MVHVDCGWLGEVHDDGANWGIYFLNDIKFQKIPNEGQFELFSAEEKVKLLHL